MIPEESLTPEPLPSQWSGAATLSVDDLIDYEDGGIGIQDPSRGLLYQVWRARVLNDGREIVIDSESTDPVVWYSGESITEVSLAFDRNMNPAVAFVESRVAKLNWYDSSAGQQVTTEFPGIQNPRLTHDDKRPEQSANSDIIMAYLSGGNLCYRQQRDRYQIEHVLEEGVEGKLVKIGMSRQMMLQFEFELPTVEPKVMLDVSGNTRTWDMNQAWRSMGKKGEYDTRVIWRRLGQHRSFTPRIAISAPVKRAIFAAHADIRPQRS